MSVILPGRSRQRIVDAARGYPVRMSQVQAFATVHRSADSMWHDLGSFQALARWHPMVKATHGEGEEPGATRSVESRDGLAWVERLTEVDPEQRLYRYEVTSKDVPITDFRGEFRMREDGPSKCTVVWTAQFAVTSGDEKKVSDTVREYLRAGVRCIEQRYSARPASALSRRLRTLKRRYNPSRR
jgi:Polyketide cyclase / dehydrase and lipid transport